MKGLSLSESSPNGRLHVRVSMSLHCHCDTRYEKLASAPTTAHIESTGILSTDGARAECDTSREWIKVSWLYSYLRPVSCSSFAVTLTLARCEFIHREMLDAIEKALGLPGLSRDKTAWKYLVRLGICGTTMAVARAVDTQTCQSVGTSSMGLDESRAHLSPRED